MTATGQSASIGRMAQAMDRLQRDLHCQVLRPGDLAYDQARQVRQALADRYPAAIVRARTAAQVAQAVRFAREHDLPLAVRSGGHSLSGKSVADGAIVIDLSGMDALDIDPQQRRAAAGPGVTSGRLGWAAQEFGLALSTGDVSSVGLGGLTLGGGIGYMVRKYGLTIDHLLSAEVVTAQGEVLRASADEHPDLFWALRGGGGNFGIVTRLQYRLEPAGTVLGGAIVLPPTLAVLRGYRDYAVQAPDELTTISALTHLPPLPFLPQEAHGRLAFVIFLVALGELEHAQRTVEPLRSLAAPIGELVGPMPYPAIYQFSEEATQRSSMATRSMFAHALPDEALEAMIDHTAQADSFMHMLQVRVLGGAMARVPREATAFTHRDKPFMVSVLNEWQDPAETERQLAWTDEAWQALRGYGSGVYVNFLEDEGDGRIREAYGEETYARLAAVKRRYDPTNVFRLNQNIPPA
jgi:FAD/FMN-containing dehydrogenase